MTQKTPWREYTSPRGGASIAAWPAWAEDDKGADIPQHMPACEALEEAGGGALPCDCGLALIFEGRIAERRARDLVRLTGRPGQCRGCGAEIMWLAHTPREPGRNPTMTPYDEDGTNHFITCPKREEFRNRG